MGLDSKLYCFSKIQQSETNVVLLQVSGELRVFLLFKNKNLLFLVAIYFCKVRKHQL